MNLEFCNACSKNVIVTGNAQTLLILPKQTAVLCDVPPDGRFAVRCEENSRYKRKQSMYTLNVEAVCLCESLRDGDRLTITREKVRAGENVSLERLFVSSEIGTLRAESFSVPDEKRIKKLFRKKKMLRFFFIEPIEESTGLCVLALLAGIALTCIFGSKYAVLYFPAAYLLILLFNLLAEKFFNRISGDETAAFYRFFQNEWIAAYYADPNREPFLGEIEIDK